jgi:hypothetical protein
MSCSRRRSKGNWVASTGSDSTIRAMANDPYLLEQEERIMREFEESDAETARMIPD